MKRVLLLSLLMLAVATSLGCASAGGGGGDETGSAKKASAAPIPASSPLAKIEMGMSDNDVRKILGEPDQHATTT